MSSDHGHSMKFVARRTGLTPHTIRVWERRYGAVVPRRTATNRRLYSDSDIERLLLLRLATLAGHSIGRIANLPIDNLRGLVEADPTIVPEAQSEVVARPQISSPEQMLAKALDAVRSFDAERLESVLHHASAAFSQPVLIEQFLAPFLERIGEHWREGTMRISEEHFCSSMIRGFLAILTRPVPDSAAGPLLLVATPAGQHHEFGALFTAAAALTCGWRILYLGSNLPAEEIAGAAAVKRVRAVALSIIYPADDPHLAEELQLLRRCLAPGIAIVAGGRAAPSYRVVINAIGAERLSDSLALRKYLDSLRLPSPSAVSTGGTPSEPTPGQGPVEGADPGDGLGGASALSKSSISS